MKNFTIRDMEREFPTEEACLDWLRDYLYPDGIFCKNCDAVTTHHRMNTRPSYSCDRCGRHEHPMAGTIFERSRTPLRLWFHAIYLMASTRCGISAKQLERELGVTYKTAWRMFTQIRTLLADDGEGPLKGTVEIDETFVGGRPRYRQARRGPRPSTDPNQKIPVVGMVERGGGLKAWVTPDVKWKTIGPLATEHIMPASQVFTDDATQYRTAITRAGYQHSRINHSAHIYVEGNVHTNTIEGFWMLLKNGIRGAYHSVGSAYLQSYVDEYVFRYNHRKDATPMFLTMLRRVEKVGQPAY